MRVGELFTATRVGGGGAIHDDRGFGLVETIVALALMSFAALSVGQMVVTGIYVSEASADMTSVTGVASERMEALRATDYDALVVGGGLNANATGYFQMLDIDADGTDDITCRWQITDLGNALQLDVRAIGPQNATGGNREVRLAAIMAER